MASDAENIKEKLPIEEIISSYVELKKAGKYLKGLCPFHNEKTPSFTVSVDRNTFHCFGCGKHGDIFSFVQDYEGIEFQEALKLLADKAGVELEFKKNNSSSLSKKEKAIGYSVLEKAEAFYREELLKNEDAKNYLKKRGLDKEAVENWGVGYVSDSWESVRKFLLLDKNLDDKKIEEVGLIKKSSRKPGEYYDTFRSRIMFPIKDSYGNIVGFTGRYFGKNDKEVAKYLNSPDTKLFNKSQILYGFDLAKNSIRKNDFSILVEGQFDVIAAHQMNYQNTVATSGTALTIDQLKLLKRISSRLVVALDRDPAGIKASEKAWKLALELGMDVKIATLPDGKDPSDIFIENKNIWKDAIKNSKHVIDFLCENIQSEEKDKRKQALKIHEEIVPYIKMLESAVERSYFIERISTMFSISKGALEREVEEYVISNSNKNNLILNKEQNQNNPVITGDKQKEAIKNSLVEQIATLFSWQNGLKDSVIKFEDYFDKIIDKDKIQEEISKKEEELKQNDKIIYKLDEDYKDSDKLKKAIEELIDRFNKDKLLLERNKLQEELSKLEILGEKEKVNKILEELQEINRKIQK